MTHTPHELAADFPEFADKMHELKISDNHFATMADSYHQINRQIHRIEVGEEHYSDLEEEQMHKQRVSLKDEIYAYLQKS